MDLSEFQNIIEWLRDRIAGTEFEGRVYAVGGCMRDIALGHDSIKDVDLTVELPNGGLRFAQWLHEQGLTRSTPTTFPRYGTAMLHLRDFPFDEIEIVQTRSGKYTGIEGDDPAEKFGPVAGDALLRDLSINSIYLNVSTGERLDPSGKAFEDIKACRLRTPDSPERVFYDDPVRILRVIRFATTLGWELDSEMLEAMESNAAGLRNIKVERMRQELEKMFIGPDPARALDLLNRSHALGYVFPDICRARTFELHGRPLIEHLIETVRQAAALDPRLSVRLAAAVHDLGKVLCQCREDKHGIPHWNDHESRGARMARKLFRCMKFDSPVVRDAIFLVGHHHFPGPKELANKDHALSRLKRLHGECGNIERFKMLLTLMEADREATPPEFRIPDRIEWMRETTASLCANGKDGFGYNAGRFSDTDFLPSPKVNRKAHKHTHRGGHRRRRYNRHKSV